MSDEPKTKTGNELAHDLGIDEHDPDAGDRPTVAPPFDVSSYARTTAAEHADADSEEPPPESERPTVAPPFDVAAFAKESYAASSGLPADLGPSQMFSSPSKAKIEVPPILDLRQRIAQGDYVGGLSLAESMLATDPGSLEVAACAEVCRSKLAAKYAAQLGPLDGVPELVVGHDQLRALHIDHRSGFLLSLVDGVSSFELILDICGMPRPDAVRILAELVGERIVSIPSR